MFRIGAKKALKHSLCRLQGFESVNNGYFEPSTLST